ncbi:HSP20 family protein [Altererythrobacter atlanticus]|uniref:Spore protein SP21 n=1 Tax=Croceibacterium atlanticum TaxID=1267766 RepID=A0A0F7KS66_9SPHN|nr:Hsp20/alpha crystallin family protein [Croceibacterium atlanticum]AKH42117.1 Spore protein SP21 [Croceibacterium atlanticum]MBB5733313.1 HSP20 family protein [Croceibacterium atlanticum]
MNDQSSVPATTKRSAGSLLDTPIGRLRDEIDRLFDDFGIGMPGRGIFAFPGRTELMPAVDLADKGDHYELAVELPGMEEKDIDIEVSEGVLSISGEKREQSEKKEAGYLMSERRYGSFNRRISLPPDIDPDSIEAKVRQGVLKLEIKKDQEVQKRKRKIKIKA